MVSGLISFVYDHVFILSNYTNQHYMIYGDKSTCCRVAFGVDYTEAKATVYSVGRKCSVLSLLDKCRLMTEKFNDTSHGNGVC